MPGSCLTETDLAGRRDYVAALWRAGRQRLESVLGKLRQNPRHLPALLVALPVLQAAASTGSDDALPRVAVEADATAIQLAQYGDVEIYIDEYGRRVIVDSFTGEVLGIERPAPATASYRRAARLRALTATRAAFLLDDPN